jgi:hypothetical protein
MKTRFAVLALVWWALFGTAVVAQAESYTFTTIAGQAGATGSLDGTNSDARFYFPSSIAVDGAGALYVSDLSNQTIRKLTPMGTNWVVTTIAGKALTFGSADGTNSDARFHNPNGIMADQVGNLFVVDHYNATIRKVTPQGPEWVVTTAAGLAGSLGSSDGTNSDARFWGPTGIAVDNDDHLYVADTSNDTIRGIVPQGTNWVVSTLAGAATFSGFTDGTNELAEFSGPIGVAVTGQGVLYLTDYGNNAIRQIAPLGPDWATTTIAGVSGLVGTNDGSGSVAAFNSPNGIAVDAATNLYVADQFNHTIRKLSPNAGGWDVTTIAGAPGVRGTNNGTGSAARFNKPWGIAVDTAGTLFVVDYLNHTIRKGVSSAPPIPSLQIFRASNQVVLAWPASATNYVLETAATLQPGTPWASLTNGIAVSGTNRVLTNFPGTAAAFYRLHKH